MTVMSRAVNVIIGFFALAATALTATVLTAAGITNVPDSPPKCDLHVTVEFDDGFPNTFTIANRSSKPYDISKLEFDFSKTFGDVVLDVGSIKDIGANTGANYEIRFNAEQVKLKPAKAVSGTVEKLNLQFATFPPGEAVTIALDLDDTSKVSSRGRHRVTFGELANGVITIQMKGKRGYPVHLDAMFNQFGTADSAITSCI